MPTFLTRFFFLFILELESTMGRLHNKSNKIARVSEVSKLVQNKNFMFIIDRHKTYLAPPDGYCSMQYKSRVNTQK